MFRTRLTELVGFTLPIQQAPMGTVSSPRLAVAVAEAGGIGSINTLAMSRETLRRRLEEMREQTDGVLAVWDPAPRTAGAALVLKADGTFVGTVGGAGWNTMYYSGLKKYSKAAARR